MNALSIKQAIKIHHQAVEKPEDYDILADELNLDIALDAEKLIMLNSPSGTRQIVRKYDNKSRHVPLTFEDMAFYAQKESNTTEDSLQPKP